MISLYGLAERYGRSPQTIHNWDRSGKMPTSFKLGGRRLWWVTDIKHWEDQDFPERKSR